MARLLPRGVAHPGTNLPELLTGGEVQPSSPGTGPASGLTLPANPNDPLTGALRETSQQLQQWRAATQAHAEALALNTSALQQNTSSRGSTAGSLLNTASSFLGGGLGALPLVSGLLGLFGGGPKSQPLLWKYMAPPSLSIQNATDGSGSGAAVYDQFGSPRAASGGAATAPPPASVTVNVQAMDSRSFLDHSYQIAQAVREAMLNLHPINDVVNEL